MENTINIFGIIIKPIHLQVVQIIFFVILSAGAWRWFVLWWRGRGNRQLDHYLNSACHVSEPDADGFRTLTLRNLGRTERIETVIRGEHERKWLLAAAQHCDWTHRFIKDREPEHQNRILHVVRNEMTAHFAEGEAARLAGLPTRSFDIYYSPTGADAMRGGIRMIRNILATEHVLRVVQEHPVDKWHYEIDKVTGEEAVSHKVRLETLRQMADALFNCSGCRLHEGQWVRIVGWLSPSVKI